MTDTESLMGREPLGRSPLAFTTTLSAVEALLRGDTLTEMKRSPDGSVLYVRFESGHSFELHKPQSMWMNDDRVDLEERSMNDDDQHDERIGEQVSNTLRNALAIVDEAFPPTGHALEPTLMRAIALMYTIDVLDGRS